MTIEPPPRVLRARCVGATVHAALRAGRRGEVAAVFRHAFYLRFGDDWICVGEQRIGRGPLNMQCQGAIPVERLHVKQVAACHDCRLVIGGDVEVDWSRASQWYASAPPSWSAESLQRGLATLDRLFSAISPPPEGLARFCVAGFRSSSLLACRAAPAIDALAEWLRREVDRGAERPSQRVCELLGLGPGLTPSGDDLLGAVLVVLQRLGRPVSTRLLWQTIEPQLAIATNDISAAHLRAAVAGECGEDLDRMIDALLRGDTGALGPAWTRIAASGHGSTRDALAGALLVLRSRLAATVPDRSRQLSVATGGFA